MSKPLLTIGMIFRNDSRSLERCLKALEPLRKAIPCELIMADTGSADGSRKIAERYADTVFDFPWIDDFSAARNAVMDKASGKWYFTVDTDEYLDENITELTRFLQRDGLGTETASVVQRNYREYEMDDLYTDFMAQRLLKMSVGVRYQGVVHETWSGPGRLLTGVGLVHTVLHHDGYVGLTDERGQQKRKRNLELLKEKLAKHPDNLMIWLQIIESGYAEPDAWETLCRAAELVEAKKEQWDRAGPPILRYAATRAESDQRSDAEEWIERAKNLFPDSLFTRLDVQCSALTLAMRREDYAGCIEPGECYLAAMEEYRAEKGMTALMTSAFQFAVKPVEQAAKVALALAYEKLGNPKRALELLGTIDFSRHFDALQTLRATTALMNIHGKSELDTAPVITRLWEGITSVGSSKEQDAARRQSFFKVVSTAFDKKNRDSEATSEYFCRSSYTLFLPLEEQCEAGRAAAILGSDSPAFIAAKLGRVKDWVELPAAALIHALGFGVRFPLADRPLKLEEMDGLAEKMAEDVNSLFTLAINAAETVNVQDWQGLLWTRGLIMSALRAFSWGSEDVGTDTGLNLTRAFAKVEGLFLPFCYTPQMLSGDLLFVLPPLHRFGWYLIQALEALDSGDPAGYVRLLREGLTSSEGVAELVEFLVNYTPELRAHEPSKELEELADHIRAVLSSFSPEDPAVEMLKQSKTYQKVAYLIEGTEPPVAGGQMQ